MKPILVLSIGILVCLAGTSIAQNNEDINLDALKSPSSPASQIIGNQPSSITRPKSWNEFEVSLFTNFLNDDGGVDLNRVINIELAPYWLKKDRKIATEDFIFQDDPLENLKQNFSISLATANNFILKDSLNEKNTAIAIGMRTMLWRGTKAEKEALDNRYAFLRDDLTATTRIGFLAVRTPCDNCTKEAYWASVKSAMESQGMDRFFPAYVAKEYIAELMLKIEEDLMANLEDTSKDGNDYANYINTISEEKYFSNLKENTQILSDMIADRKGFKLELAAALVVDFPTNETNFSTVPQYSFWITPSYQPFDTNWIEFLGVAKYQGFHLDYYQPFLDQDTYNKNALDVGLKLVLKSNKFSFELEGASRRASQQVRNISNEFNTETSSENKYVARINYKISDQFVITYDFGKDFSVLGEAPGTLISQFALNYALGTFKAKNLEYSPNKRNP